VLVKDGELCVVHESSGHVFETLRRGDWCGTTPLLTARGATASVLALAPVTVFELSARAVERIAAAYPDGPPLPPVPLRNPIL
jgi:CRP-like cAMP-binding protein